MNPAQKEEAKKKILSEEVFGPLVDQTFSDADTDKSGYIDKKELKPLLTKISKQLSLPVPDDKDIQDGLKQLDMNQDGKLQFNEFLPFYKQVYEQIMSKI